MKASPGPSATEIPGIRRHRSRRHPLATRAPPVVAFTPQPRARWVVAVPSACAPRRPRPWARPLGSHAPCVRLDEDATAERIAEQRLSGHQFWEPALVPARERWFELALVLDRGATMVVWRPLLAELRRLFGYQGAFARVRVWGLDADGPEPLLYAGHQPRGGRPCQPTALIAGPSRRLILVASDCIGRAWHNGSVIGWLTDWGAARALALLQPLPQRLWDGTALGRGLEVRLRARRPGPLGGDLEVLGAPAPPSSRPGPSPVASDLRLPIITLEPPVIQGWGKLLCGRREAWCIGVQFGPETPYAPPESPDAAPPVEPDQTEILARLADFQSGASPLARRLAALLAAAPLTLPVMRLVQQTTLPESGQGHLAEIFLSGLLRQDPSLTGDADEPFYDYRGDCRQRLLDGIGVRDSCAVLQAVSAFVAERTGGVLDFAALIADPDAAVMGGQATLSDANTRYFAEIGAAVLRRLGRRYARLADGLVAPATGEPEAMTRALGAQWDEETPQRQAAIQNSEQPLRRTPNVVYSAAVSAIAEALNRIPPLAAALTDQLVGRRVTEVSEIAQWLCAQDGGLGSAFHVLNTALQEAARELHQQQGDCALLREQARKILGWMLVFAVMEGYDQEDARLAKRWFDGVAFSIPLGRSPCVEVLSARWRDDKAEFSTEPDRHDYGKDDITPNAFGGIGFDDPNRLDPERAVEYVWRLVYQKVYGKLAPDKLPQAKIDDLRAWLHTQLARRKRRLRLVIDRQDWDSAYPLAPTLQAIHDALPQIHLIVIDSGATADDEVFVLPASQLAAGIYECRQTIEAIT